MEVTTSKLSFYLPLYEAPANKHYYIPDFRDLLTVIENAITNDKCPQYCRVRSQS